MTVVQVVDNRRLILLNKTLQYKHLPHSYAWEYLILAPVLRSHTRVRTITKIIIASIYEHRAVIHIGYFI